MTTPDTIQQAPLLRLIPADELDTAAPAPTDPATLDAAAQIVEDVRTKGTQALRDYAERFNERSPDQPLVLGPPAMQAALDDLAPHARDPLERAAERIRNFAEAQRSAITATTINIPGGTTGHTIEPINAAGCYAPAGRYPLPSSVLMTAITARVAGCQRVCVASPGASPINLAAAAIAGVDQFLPLGGAHAIAALAYGFDHFQPVDTIAGPGNKWVTAAKQLLAGTVGIDMLAGPSELLIIADQTADPALVAADLLAQAEHDDDARAMLLTLDPSLIDRVNNELATQLETLPTAATARNALRNAFAIIATDRRDAAAITDRIAPEHLQIMTQSPQQLADKIQNAGAVFLGQSTPEVLADYGIGPNHTLPTAGTARFNAGLSVINFLRLRTWIRIEQPKAAQPAIRDTIAIAELEGLAAHAESARRRLQSSR